MTLQDIPTIISVIFAVGLTLTLCYLIIAPMLGTPVDVFGVLTSVLGMLKWVDTLILLILVLSGVSGLVFASMVRVHPSFLFLSILLLGLIEIIMVFLANAWETYASNSGIVVIMPNFPYLQLVMSYLPQITLGYGILFLIALHGKPGVNVG